MARRDVRYARKSQVTAFVTDHGALTGLADDDHTFYHTDVRGDARYYTQTQLDARTLNDISDVAVGSPTDGYLLQWDNGAAEFNLVAPPSGGASALDDLSDVTLTAPATGGVLYKSAGDWIDTDAITIDPAGNVELSANGTVAAVVQPSGIAVHATSFPQLNFKNGAGTSLGFLFYEVSSNKMTLRNDQNSGHIILVGQTAAVDRTLVEADPDTSVDLYYAGKKALTTQPYGAFIYSTADDSPYLGFYQDNLTTRNSYIQARSTTGLVLANEVHGTPITLQAEAAFGSVHTLLVADPDTSVELYYANSLALNTESDGLSISSTQTSVVNVRLKDNVATEIGRLRHGGTNLDLRNEVDSGTILIQASNASSAITNLLVGDPDAEVKLYYAGTSKLETTSSGAQVNGLLSRGSKGQVTISSGAVTATNGWHDIDTEADAATDDLDTITYTGAVGSVLTLTAESSSRTVVVKNNTGNLRLNSDFSMDTGFDTITLMWNGGSWLELSRSNNA